MTITLLSDLGTRDASVPIARAILQQHAPQAAIVDISHCVATYDVQQAAYLLLSAYKAFAKGTVHIAPVDVFSGATPRMLMARKDGHLFIAPDNGLLPLAFGSELENIRLCFSYEPPFSFNQWIDNAGTVINTVAQGWVLPYRKYELSHPPRLPAYTLTPTGIECTILYIDRYKNVVLNMTKKQFERTVGSKPFVIRIIKMNDITRISTHYSDAPINKAMCRYNSAGFMEIAINRSHAASHMGLDALPPGDLRYHKIRIFF